MSRLRPWLRSFWQVTTMPRRQVRDADGRVGHVDVLAAGAARAVGVDAEVLVGDLDLDVVVDLGRDVDRGKRRVPALRRVERRDPDEPVDAHLALEVAVGVVADDVQRRALQARLLAVLPVDELGLPAAALGEAHVHPQEHLRPVLRLRAAGARVDREPGVVGVLGGAHLDGQLELVARRRRAAASASRASFSAGSPSRSSSAKGVELAPRARRAARGLELLLVARVWRRVSWASSGRDQKSGAEAFSLSPSSALRAASRSKIAPKRVQALRGGRESGDEVVAFGHASSGPVCARAGGALHEAGEAED